MGSAEEPDAELVMLSRKLLREISDPVSIAKVIKAIKAVNSGGSFGDKELYNANKSAIRAKISEFQQMVWEEQDALDADVEPEAETE